MTNCMWRYAFALTVSLWGGVAWADTTLDFRFFANANYVY